MVRQAFRPKREEIIWGWRKLHYECMTCEVVTVINIEITALWDVAPCSSILTTWSHIPEDL
jgi:hypothetical protein